MTIKNIVAEINSRISKHNDLAEKAAELGLNSTLEANELCIRQYKSLLDFYAGTLSNKEILTTPC